MPKTIAPKHLGEYTGHSRSLDIQIETGAYRPSCECMWCWELSREPRHRSEA